MRRLTRYTSLLFFTLALLAAGFHSVVTPSPAYAVTVVGTKAADELSRADRVEVFEEVWETILEKYYNASFNGVDWSAVGRQYRPLIEQAASDADFYEVLKRMVGELRDAHTRFHTPEQRRERERLQAVSAGVSIFDVEGKPVVVNVEANSEASRAGVEAGMIVLAIDGKPVAERLAEARARVAGTSTDRAVRLRVYRMIIDGDPGSILRLSLERADRLKARGVVDAAHCFRYRDGHLAPAGVGVWLRAADAVEIANPQGLQKSARTFKRCAGPRCRPSRKPGRRGR